MRALRLRRKAVYSGRRRGAVVVDLQRSRLQAALAPGGQQCEQMVRIAAASKRASWPLMRTVMINGRPVLASASASGAISIQRPEAPSSAASTPARHLGIEAESAVRRAGVHWRCQM
jgi:predicted phage gp36 major capsid-like protein